jgi:hypothetical protein
MERIERDFKIDYSLDWEYGISIEDLRKDLDAIEKLGANHVDIQAGIAWGVEYVTIEPIARRLETEQECQQRLKEIQDRKNAHIQQEKEELERLKKKYEDK